MARGTAECTCEKCGKTFVKYSYNCRNRSEADRWEEWAKGNYTLCPECYREQQKADNAQKSGFNGRESDSPEEWDYMVKDVFYTLNRVAERKFYTSLTREQATAFCKALEGDGGHILIGGMDIPASSIRFHWGDYHPGEYLDLDPLFEN